MSRLALAAGAVADGTARYYPARGTRMTNSPWPASADDPPPFMRGLVSPAPHPDRAIERRRDEAIGRARATVRILRHHCATHPECGPTCVEHERWLSELDGLLEVASR